MRTLTVNEPRKSNPDRPRKASGRDADLRARASSPRKGLGAGPQANAAKGGSLPFVVLASKSPRRRQLLEENGVKHVAVQPRVDDADLAPGNVSAEQWVAALAYLKAASAARDGIEGDEAVMLGADTVVVHNGRIIGQPRDAADAERILRLLSDDDHEVLTGVALVDPETGRREIFVDRANVAVGRLSDQQVRDYVASGQWRGKAGAYNLAERLEAGWPIRYTGDPGTIMGLPIRALLPRLAAFAAA